MSNAVESVLLVLAAIVVLLRMTTASAFTGWPNAVQQFSLPAGLLLFALSMFVRRRSALWANILIGASLVLVLLSTAVLVQSLMAR